MSEDEAKTAATSDAEMNAATDAEDETNLAPAAEVAKENATPKTLLERIDDAIFATESSLMALFLSAITVFVFVDVIYRRLVAPDSKVGSFLAWAGGVTDETTRAMLDHDVAPYVSILLGFLLLWSGAASAEYFRKKKFFAFAGSSAVVAAILTALITGLFFLMVHASSQTVYGLLYGGALIAYVMSEVRDKRGGWQIRMGVAVFVVTPIFALLALNYFPQEYVWAKEISMLCVLWVGFFGASVCAPIGKHIRVDTFDKAIPEAARKYVTAAGHFFAAGFAGLMAYMGYDYVFRPGGPYQLDTHLELTGFPDWIQTIAVPVAFGMTAIRFFASGVSSLRGGSYGAAAKPEGMAEAEEAAKKERDAEKASVAAGHAPTAKRPPITLIIVGVLIVGLPFLGPGGILMSAILVMMVLGLPLFVVLGVVAIMCFMLWAGEDSVLDIALIERIRGLADNQALLAIPFFVMSGAIMSRGNISKKLVSFSMALVGWLPGGLAVSAVLACMIFAAISGSSPATVVAIGGMMAPALIKGGFSAPFSRGLVTSAGSLGILIPPSIPMIVYAIVNTSGGIEVERLFACGYGPGFVIGGILMMMSMYVGVKNKLPRQAFSLTTLGREAREGFWALMFPIAISAGIYGGIFNAIESACFSVVYAVVVEVYVHRAMTLSDVPKVFEETGVMLGSFLIILVVAMTFGEFLDVVGIPAMAADWVREMEFEPWQFLIVVNLLLLVVGCLLDIMSAIFIFVPLLAPMAMAAGIDPLHFGIIFIVNLEIGYLTPPVGLNLFVASTLFNQSVGYMVRAVLPFVAVMLIGLGVITFTDSVTVGVANLLMGPPPEGRMGTGEMRDDEGDEPVVDGSGGPAHPACDPPEDLNCDGNVTMEEMTDYAAREEEAPAPRCDPPEDLNCDGNVTMEEMTDYADQME